MVLQRDIGRGIWAIVCILGVGVTACSDSFPSGPDVLNVAGTYDYSFSVSDPTVQLSCTGFGTATIDQDGSEFSATYEGVVSCDGPGGQITNSGTGEVSGLIDDGSVSFSYPLPEGDCLATGTATGTPVDFLSGNATCSLTVSEPPMQLTGDWQASR